MNKPYFILQRAGQYLEKIDEKNPVNSEFSWSLNAAREFNKFSDCLKFVEELQATMTKVFPDGAHVRVITFEHP